MLSNSAKVLIESEDYLKFVRRRGRLSWLCFILAVSIVIVYDLLSIFFPQFAGAPIWADTVITFGVVSAYFVLAFIVFLAVYYVHWVNREFRKISASHFKPDLDGSA